MKISLATKLVGFIIVFILLIETICYFNNKTLHELLYPKDYEVDFNEEKYYPTENIGEYKETVKKGYEIMKKTKLVVGGLFRNSSDIFDKFKKRMNKLKELFEDVQIVLFENDSTDNSRVLLLDWEKESPNVHVIKCKENDYCLLKKSAAISHGALSENRIKKMTEYRNIVKHYVDANFSSYDYFMVIDTDARGAFSINGLAYSFGNKTQWDMIGAYGVFGLTLTFSSLMYYDYMALFENYTKYFLFGNLSQVIAVNTINKNSDLLKVNQAFGGLAIYKMSSIKNVDYTPKDNKYICEHISLNNNMRDNGHDKFYINPKLIFLVGKQGPDLLFLY